MMTKEIFGQRIQFGIQKSKTFEIHVDDKPILVCAGESVAAALIASGIKAFRKTDKRGMPRGLYCGIGQCHECRLTINGVPDTLACQTPVAPGMRVSLDALDEESR